MNEDLLDRRLGSRLEECLPAWYRFDHRTFRRSSVLDVSEGGARLVTHDPVPARGEVHLTLCLDQEEHVTVVARRAWQRPLRRGGFVVGIEFQDGSSDQGALGRWVRRRVQLGQLRGAA